MLLCIAFFRLGMGGCPGNINIHFSSRLVRFTTIYASTTITNFHSSSCSVAVTSLFFPVSSRSIPQSLYYCQSLKPSTCFYHRSSSHKFNSIATNQTWPLCWLSNHALRMHNEVQVRQTIPTRRICVLVTNNDCLSEANLSTPGLILTPPHLEPHVPIRCVRTKSRLECSTTTLPTHVMSLDSESGRPTCPM